MLLSAFRKMLEVFCATPFSPPYKRKWLMRISFTSFMVLVFFVSYANSGRGQRINESNISVRFEHTPLELVFKKLSTLSGYNFAYKDVDIANTEPVNLTATNTSLSEVLNRILGTRRLNYVKNGDNIIIVRLAQLSNRGIVTDIFPVDTLSLPGIVIDSAGDPVAGVSIIVSRANYKTATEANGRFYIRGGLNYGDIIIAKSVSYKINSIVYRGQRGLTIHLQDSVASMSDVVVTGMMTFDKKTFSGATATYTGQELKTVTNTNVVTALKTLDPSFLIIENNIAGSNPNVLPTINVRGTTSIPSSSLQNEFSTDVNQPLFILDNFETDLKTVMDLDINRIASVTLLKDAASTAIYGSRASNGVIVIETIKPRPGKIRLSYNTDWNLEFPDLSGYNMMNASEKLQFEKLSGVYTAPTYLPSLQNSYYDVIYSQHLQDITSGVNTYWLSVPLQNSVSQRHSLYAEGGSGALLFNAGGDYTTRNGVMKGSGYSEWNGRLNLTYRAGSLSVNNNLSINGYTSTGSPYGSFTTWVNTNPYYKKLPADSMYLYTFYDYINYVNNQVANPLYNASLNSFNKSKNIGITDNFQIIYNIDRYLKFQGTFQIAKSTTESDVFVSPLNSAYVTANYLKKGSYSFSETNKFSYTGSAMLSYAQAFGLHTINVNSRAEVNNTENHSNAFVAVGFPSSTNGSLSQSYGYADGSTPSYAKYLTRRLSFTNTATYTYDQRYSVDASYNLDGSTAFGKNNVFSPFYSVGASWNLSNEAFIKQIKWINMLRLRGNYGVTGNQSFSSYTSITTYSYLNNYNYSGIGVDVGSLGNPDLKWQNTYQLSYGLDASLLKGRMGISFNGYRKLTDPLVVAVSTPLSTGLSSIPFNAGKLDVRGMDGSLSFSPVYHLDKNVIWNIRLTGSYYISKYQGFGNLLSSLNDSLQSSSSLQRFVDGNAPDDIWAVRSLGIDPATGREVFLKKDGVTRTFNYSATDIVKVGNSRPAVQGVLTNSITLKGFTVSMSFRYILHQDIINTALFNKVENISMTDVINNNQDKRALYERWQKPGDHAEFKAVSLTATTPISSRFIQRENTLSLESFSCGYDFSRSAWIMRSKVFSGIRLTGYMNDVFRISTVKRERGIDYPFSETGSLSLSVNFK